MTNIGLKGELYESREEKSIEWKISNFSSLSRNSRNINNYYSSPSFTFANISWCLYIHPGGYNYPNDVFIHLSLHKTSTKLCPLTYTFFIKRADGMFFRTLRSKNFDNKDFGFVDSFRGFDLSEGKSEFLPSDVLTVVCRLKLPSQAEEIKENSMELIELEKLSENLKELFSSKKNCDLMLKVKEKDFDVHRSILAARSPVFATMFDHDTLEKQTGVISVTDCDPESFEEFLKYLYTGRSKDISSKNVLELYQTADKYNVVELKSFCLKYMMGNLQVDNVLNVIMLADQYEERELLSLAQDFFNRNVQKIFPTAEWESFSQKNYRLAKKIMTEMFEKVNIRINP